MGTEDSVNANDALDLVPPESLRGGVIGPVELRVPPDTQLSRVVRLAAGAVASMAGFDVDLIEDTKLTVSEVVLALIELGSGGVVDISVEADGSVLAIRASSATERVDLEDPDLTLCTMASRSPAP